MQSLSSRERHPENDRIFGETDGKVPFSIETDNSEKLTTVESGPVQLSPEQIALIDGALNREGFLPGDLQSANPEKLQDGFMLLASSADRVAEKNALTYIVGIVREGIE